MIIALKEIKAKTQAEINLFGHSVSGCHLFVNETLKRGVALYTSKKLKCITM